jgi:hypothetical protein
MARHRTLLAVALIALIATPLAAQEGRRIQDWQYRWYWGLKGGLGSYELPSDGRVFVPQFGGEWLITQRRAALYVSYSQTFTVEQDTFQLAAPVGTANITFDAMRRLQLAVVALVGDGTIQPYAGGGFTLHILSSARLTTGTASQTQQDVIDDAASGAFLFGIIGVQMRLGRKAALFAAWQYSPQGRDFMLQGSAMTFEGGIRYALLGSREEDTTRRR